MPNYNELGRCRLLVRGCWFAVVFLLLSVGGAAAESLIQVYQQAAENDPLAKTTEFKQLIAEEQQRQAFSEFLPKVSGVASYSGISQNIISSENSVYDSGKADYGAQDFTLTLDQPIFNFANHVGWKQSKINSLKAKLEVVVSSQDLIIRVAEKYLLALAAKDYLDSVQAEQAAVKQHYELAKERLDMGLIPITDLHDAKARLAATEAQISYARYKFEDALQSLNEMTGGDIQGLSGLAEDVKFQNPQPDDVHSWLQGALDQNPAVEVQQKAVEIAQLSIRRTKAKHWPVLNLVGAYERGKNDGSLYGGGSDVESYEAKLQLTVPIYQGGAVSSQVRGARQELAIARQELNHLNRSVQRQTKAAFLGVTSALHRIGALNESVIANQLALDAKREGYLSGLFTSLAVLDAERDLFLVRNDWSQARYDYILNSLKLKKAVGSLQVADLEEFDRWFVK